MRGRGWGGRGGGGGARGWSRGTARGIPVVDVCLGGSLPTSEPERVSDPLTLAPQPEPQLEPELNVTSTRLDPQAPAFVKTEMNQQAPEYRHHPAGAGQHLMSMLASPAPHRSLVPGPPAVKLLPGPPDVGQRLYAHPHTRRLEGALPPPPPPRRCVYRAVDDSERRAVQRALAQHLDPGELLTAP